MANREVSVAICGAVVGIILGAGSLSFSQDESLAGSAVTNLLQTRRATGNQVESLRQRAINQRLEEGELGVSPEDDQEYPTVKDDIVPAVATPVVTPKRLTICRAVTEVLAAVRNAHDTIIPKTLSNTGMRATLAAKIAEIGADTRYCNGTDDDNADEQETTPAKTTKKSSIKKDPCEGLTPFSTRYTLCKLRSGALNQ